MRSNSFSIYFAIRLPYVIVSFLLHFRHNFKQLFLIMQESNTAILTKISETIDALPKDWASYSSKHMGVKEGTVRAYARGDRCQNGQHIQLLKHLKNYQSEIARTVKKLIA